ncbi:rifampicin phosphotransferase-like [Watersipora subatra]|uniref:rifampicin phosphotransferase-like n=1 Tax=Watersipora subatra TaxID=2589382 RepID=UPI00355B600F
MVLNSNLGLGESVVSGVSEPDTFYITRSADNELLLSDKKLGRKEVQYLIDDSGEVTRQMATHNSGFSISDDMALLLARVGLELEQGFGHPCDIEWAVCQSRIYLLQSRPITTLHTETQYELLHEFDSPLVMDHEMLSTMNIGEVIPEAVCPLTYSTVISCLEHAMQKFVRNLGHRCSADAMITVKIFYSRLFINVHSLEVHKGRSLLADRRMMELALAGHMIDSMTDDEVTSYHHTVPFLDRLFNSFRFVYSIWTGLGRCLAHKQKVTKMSLPETTDCMELMAHIEEGLSVLQEVFTDDLPAASLSAVYSQIIMSILTKRSQVWENKHFADLASLLGCHLTEIESIGVPEGLEMLSNLIRDFPDLAAKFCSVTPEEGHELLMNDNRVRDAYISFMDRFGHRGIGELDVRHRSWSQEPAILIETLQLMVPHSFTDHTIKRSVGINDVVDKLESKLSNLEKSAIRFLLPKTKAAVNNREVCKSLLVKAVFNVKVAFWRLSKLMHSQGYLPSPDLLFFLTPPEIYEVLNGQPGTHLGRAKRRSRIFEMQKAMKFSRFSDGIPVPLETACDTSDVAVKIRGLPVSVGEVTGVARVVKCLAEANNIQKDEIMIVPYTDIGWTPFFPLISGVITEQGGLVSHGAVVAREYGIPCVASCTNATVLFNSGDLIHMNGSTGIISRLKSSAEMSANQQDITTSVE